MVVVPTKNMQHFQLKFIHKAQQVAGIEVPWKLECSASSDGSRACEHMRLFRASGRNLVANLEASPLDKRQTF